MDCQLENNELKYQTLLDSLPQRIAYKDSNSVYVSCNRRYAQALGIQPAEIAGKTDYDLFPKDHGGSNLRPRYGDRIHRDRK
jgi:PAS domain S-box-containing protein